MTGQGTPSYQRRQIYRRALLEYGVILLLTLLILQKTVFSYVFIPPESLPGCRSLPEGDRSGFLNRIVYTFNEPYRWSLVALCHPQDVTRTIYRRIVGLPGEAIRLEQGDIYADGKILRKPFSLQEKLWRKTSLPSRHLWKPFDRSWKADAKGIHVETTKNTYIRMLVDQIADVPAHELRDLRISFRVTPHKARGSLYIQGTYGGREYVFLLGMDPQDRSFVQVNGRVVEMLPIRISEPSTVSLCFWDRTLALVVRGKRYFISALQTPLPGAVKGTGFAVGAVNANYSLSDVSLCRDVYYANAAPYAVQGKPAYVVAPDALFVLRDGCINNTVDDSRTWGAVSRKALLGKIVMTW